MQCVLHSRTLVVGTDATVVAADRQRRDELADELGGLPEPREARAREERLTSEMAGLERGLQYKAADLAGAPRAMRLAAESLGGALRLQHGAGRPPRGGSSPLWRALRTASTTTPDSIALLVHDQITPCTTYAARQCAFEPPAAQQRGQEHGSRRQQAAAGGDRGALALTVEQGVESQLRV
jgi:hypothetical protein